MIVIIFIIYFYFIIIILLCFFIVLIYLYFISNDEMHFHALGRTKPLKKEVIVAMYSPQAVRMAAKGSRNSDDLFDMIFCSPPSQMDMTWTRKKNKRGLKSPSETWPRGLYANSMFQRKSRPCRRSSCCRPLRKRIAIPQKSPKFFVSIMQSKQ